MGGFLDGEPPAAAYKGDSTDDTGLDPEEL
jgi:hypothetical protein